MNCLYYPTNTINVSSHGYLVLPIVSVRGVTALTTEKKPFFRNLLGFPEPWLCFSETTKVFGVFFLTSYVGSIRAEPNGEGINQ